MAGPDTRFGRSAAAERERHADAPDERRDDSPAEPVRADYAPEGADRRPSWLATLKRTATEFSEDNLMDWAAALTYYSLLSFFPALIALIGLIGLFADPQGATDTISEVVVEIGPDSAADTFAGPIESVTTSSASGIAALAGIAIALWSASAYVGAFMRASNVIYETPEGRPFWKLRPLQILVTLFILILAAITLLALVVSGPLAEAIGGAIGVSDAAVTAYQIAKWPILAVLVLTIFSVLYYASPNVKIRGFRWVTPGSVFALVAWVIASAAFAFYVANFGSYDKTYGTLGGVVIVFIWLWITNLAILFGHELNAERERAEELAEGVPRAHKEIQLEPRDEPKDQKTT
jgi:membrane protein